MTSQISQIAQDAIKEMVSKGNSTDLRHYVRSMVNCWDLDGFSGKCEAELVYRNFITSCEIRQWCRKNGRTTRKGTQHSIDGRIYTDLLSKIEYVGASGATANGVTWEVRKVDQLRNIYIQF